MKFISNYYKAAKTDIKRISRYLGYLYSDTGYQQYTLLTNAEIKVSYSGLFYDVHFLKLYLWISWDYLITGYVCMCLDIWKGLDFGGGGVRVLVQIRYLNMGASQCGNDRPGFGVPSLSQKQRANNYKRVSGFI
jgi:hypothetical protein